MTSDQKKAFLLLKSVILHHLGAADDERGMMNETAFDLDAQHELTWTQQFIQEDPLTAFERARAYLNNLATQWDNPAKLEHLSRVWESTSQKGNISEMEAMSILKLAKDWQIQRELITLVRSKRDIR
ncbi:MAG: hypothetical protein H7Z75_09930 [Ferruginibacter sp.]|nr:hypothetical protein [Cytophagales bacterium]